MATLSRRRIPETSFECHRRLTGMLPSLLPGLTIFLTSVVSLASSTNDSVSLQWKSLPSLPDTPGVASPFAGYSHGVLLVAGGANFPEAPPWKNGTKVWHDKVYALIDNHWLVVGKLPKPLAYGVSFQTSEGVLCAGGSNVAGHSTDVFLMSFAQGQLEFRNLPNLPKPLANACGVNIETTVYLFGGTESSTATGAASSLYSMNLAEKEPRWTQYPDLPGPGRILPVAAADDRSVFIFSGAALASGKDGAPSRTYLKDAWKFEVANNRWYQLADLPAPAVAAPSPSPTTLSGRMVILGGDDGSKAGFQPPENHPGFSTKALVYDPVTNQWDSTIPLKISRVTVPLLNGPNGLILPSGEARPGVRSPEVWQIRIEERK